MLKEINENEILELIRKGEHKWSYICSIYKLSEEFIERHADKVCWGWISTCQKLSEAFIENHTDEVDWDCISRYQKLSEAFIERHADKMNWYWISEYQKLSETFIEKHADKINWYRISKNQKLSKKFIRKHKTELTPYMENIEDSWQYKTEAYKKEQVIKTGLYECYDDYFIAYKGIRSDRYSKFNFQYQYLPGEVYETFADYSCDENSFGFSAWTEEEAEDYCNELVIKVKIYYKDVARVVHNGGKIRCCKMTVLN